MRPTSWLVDCLRVSCKHTAYSDIRGYRCLAQGGHPAAGAERLADSGERTGRSLVTDDRTR